MRSPEASKSDVTGRAGGWVRQGALFAALLGVTILLQISSGAYTTSFASYPDEAAHFVTSLMIRDYVAQGLPAHPVDFAEQFYAHYPRVAFGIWPPMFHAVLGAWMVPWGGNRGSAIAFEAVLAAMLCFLIYRMARKIVAGPLAFGGALLAALTPGMQQAASSVMLDTTVALFAAGGTICYGRYLQSGSTAQSAWFGVLAAGAILTKYNGLALAFVPLFGVVLTGRWELLRRRSFWLPLPIVVLIAGPWYAVMWKWILYATENGDQPIPGAGVTMLALMRSLVQGFGYLLAAGGIAGAVLHFRRKAAGTEHDRSKGIRVAAISTALSFFLFHGVVYRSAEGRYLLPALPAIVVMAAYAFRRLQRAAGETVPVRLQRAARAAVAVAAGAAACATSFSILRKPGLEYVRVTDAVLKDARGTERRVFVSSDAAGEGALVAEIAMRDQERKHVVARASKLLAERKLMGNAYRLLYHTPEEVNDVLNAYGIQSVLVDDCMRRECGQHHTLVQQAVQKSEQWRRVAAVAMPSGGATTIYERPDGAPSAERRPLTVNMTYPLGRDIQLK